MHPLRKSYTDLIHTDNLLTDLITAQSSTASEREGAQRCRSEVDEERFKETLIAPKKKKNYVIVARDWFMFQMLLCEFTFEVLASVS